MTFSRRDVFAGSAALACALSGDAMAQTRRTRRPLGFDAMGELRFEYDAALIGQMRDSGIDAITVTLCDPKPIGQEAYDLAIESVFQHDAFIAANPNLLLKATQSSDIDLARNTGRIAVFYLFQNTAQFGHNLDNVRLFHRLGVRSAQITYNHQNLAGSGVAEPEGHGLSVFGRELVARMNDENMLIDVSHANMRTMADTVAASRTPVINSHTACKAVYDNRRNTTDENLRAVAQKGGVNGICQIRPFLTSRGPGEALPDYFAHIAHAVNVAGVEHVAIGSDRDHRVIVMTEEYLAELRREQGPNFRDADWPLFIDALNGPGRMAVVRDGLVRLGYGQADVDKIIGGNLQRLYRTVIG